MLISTDIARTASQALLVLTQHAYAAVVADDEQSTGMEDAQLLVAVERLQPRALRILLTRRERFGALQPGASEPRYRRIARPFFARPLVSSLVDQALGWRAAARHEASRPVASPPPAGTPADEARDVPMQRIDDAPTDEPVDPPAGAVDDQPTDEIAVGAGLDGDAAAAVADAILVHDGGELLLAPELLTKRLPFREHDRQTMRRQVPPRAGLESP